MDEEQLLRCLVEFGPGKRADRFCGCCGPAGRSRCRPAPRSRHAEHVAGDSARRHELEADRGLGRRLRQGRGRLPAQARARRRRRGHGRAANGRARRRRRGRRRGRRCGWTLAGVGAGRRRGARGRAGGRRGPRRSTLLEARGARSTAAGSSGTSRREQGRRPRPRAVARAGRLAAASATSWRPGSAASRRCRGGPATAAGTSTRAFPAPCCSSGSTLAAELDAARAAERQVAAGERRRTGCGDGALLLLDHEHAVGATPGVTPWSPALPPGCRRAGHEHGRRPGRPRRLRAHRRRAGRPAAARARCRSRPAPRLLALRGGLRRSSAARRLCRRAPGRRRPPGSHVRARRGRGPATVIRDDGRRARTARRTATFRVRHDCRSARLAPVEQGRGREGQPHLLDRPHATTRGSAAPRSRPAATTATPKRRRVATVVEWGPHGERRRAAESTLAPAVRLEPAGREGAAAGVRLLRLDGRRVRQQGRRRGAPSCSPPSGRRPGWSGSCSPSGRRTSAGCSRRTGARAGRTSGSGSRPRTRRRPSGVCRCCSRCRRGCASSPPSRCSRRSASPPGSAAVGWAG